MPEFLGHKNQSMYCQATFLFKNQSMHYMWHGIGPSQIHKPLLYLNKHSNHYMILDSEDFLNYVADKIRWTGDYFLNKTNQRIIFLQVRADAAHHSPKEES